MKKTYDKIYNQVFSEYFTNLRKERNLTRKDVSYFLHLNQSTFNGYEMGIRDVPISVMKEMCKLYHVDFYKTFEFLDEETTKRENALLEKNDGK